MEATDGEAIEEQEGEEVEGTEEYEIKEKVEEIERQVGEIIEK
jgi:hypothetical protein